MKISENKSTSTTFEGLGIAPGLFSMLGKLGYVTPTPIQQQAIPLAIDGKDVAGIAQTGTGKTLAFGIPMVQLLLRGKGQGLIILPTRELALQVDEELNKIGKYFGLRTAVLIGGAGMQPQISALKRNPHIIIATVGRLIDHFNQHTVQLGDIEILVLDEADRMLDMGFLPQIKKILQLTSNNRQTMLFSATLPPEIMKIAAVNMKQPVRIEVAPSGATADRVTQELIIVRKENKTQLLKKVLEEYKGSALVFSRTKYGAKRIAKNLRNAGHNAIEIHSNRSLAQRREALEGFKSGRYRVLVATDIAARGIDVSGIQLVINYDLPMQVEDYIHRIGRTARAGKAGHAISFAMPSEQRSVRDIERLIHKRVPLSATPTFSAVQTAPTHSSPPRRSTHFPKQRSRHSRRVRR